MAQTLEIRLHIKIAPETHLLIGLGAFFAPANLAHVNAIHEAIQRVVIVAAESEQAVVPQTDERAEGFVGNNPYGDTSFIRLSFERAREGRELAFW